MMATLKQVPDLVSSHSVFNCNDTLFSRIEGGFYAVFSYGDHFPVAIRRRTADAPWLVNEDGYSRTTSKHKGYVARGIAKSGHPSQPMSTSALRTALTWSEA